MVFNQASNLVQEIFMLYLSDGTRDRDKDILITKDACKDGCFKGHFDVDSTGTNNARVYRTGGAAAP